MYESIFQQKKEDNFFLNCIDCPKQFTVERGVIRDQQDPSSNRGYRVLKSGPNYRAAERISVKQKDYTSYKIIPVTIGA